MQDLLQQPEDDRSAKYDIGIIRHATDPSTFLKAVHLYENGRVTKFMVRADHCKSEVIGTQHYDVVVSLSQFDRGDCNCYVGQKEVLCKHLVATAIMAVKRGQKLDQTESASASPVPVSSNRLGELTPAQLEVTKSAIKQGMRCIKAYSGPSRTWFTYQRSLAEGTSRLSEVISTLPISLQTAKIIVDILIRLDRKLSTGGVDDSDGTVGRFIQESAVVLRQFASLEPGCKQAFYRLTFRPTCFDWEVPLVMLLNQR
jgi:hypothetical protein